MSELTETVQTEDRIVDYSGRGFINMINKYYMYNINKTRNMTFLEIDPKCFFLKLCDIDGRDVHNFSKKYNNGIVHKFDLEDDKEYYIYFDEVAKFNDMTKEEQLAYLNTIKYNDVVIGCIDSKTIQAMLRSQIQIGTNYTGYIKESNLINGNYWWHINNTNLELYVNSVAKAGFGMKVQVNFGPEKEKPRYVDWCVNSTYTTLKALEDSGLFVLNEFKNSSSDKKYTYYFTVKSKEIKNDQGYMATLFSVYLYPSYGKHYFRIKFNKNMLDEFKLNMSYTSNAFDGSLNAVKEKIKTFAEAIQTKEEYRKTAFELEKL